MLERFASPSALEVKEVEVEGWGRVCGGPCLGTNVASIPAFASTGDWRLVRYSPDQAAWHPAGDNLRWVQIRASNKGLRRFHKHGEGPC